MKRQRRTGVSWTGALLFFLTVAAIVSAAVLIYSALPAEMTDGAKAGAMLGVIAAFAFLCTAADLLRRRLTVERPVRKILAATDAIAAGDFTVRLESAYLRRGEFDEIILAYTNFVSMLSQQPATLKLLPLNYRQAEKGAGPFMTTLYEPDCETVYNAIVPEYLAGLIWGALCESEASELGARRTAMDAASKNAGEMIETLSLHYNRARQAAITQEITEIVAGAEG